MMVNNENLNSQPMASAAGAIKKDRGRCPVILSNLWQNTKPTMPTSIRGIFLAIQIFIVLVGCMAGMDVYKLDDPLSAPSLNYAVVAFGVVELLSLLFAMRKPSAEA